MTSRALTFFAWSKNGDLNLDGIVFQILMSSASLISCLVLLSIHILETHSNRHEEFRVSVENKYFQNTYPRFSKLKHNHFHQQDAQP